MALLAWKQQAAEKVVPNVAEEYHTTDHLGFSKAYRISLPTQMTAIAYGLSRESALGL